MAATRVLSEFSYRSGSSSSQFYYFTISVDSTGNLSLRNIRTPTGLVIDSITSLPQSVVNDISTAMTEVEDLLASTSAVNGTLTFSSETSQDVTFDTAMASTAYRVYLAPSDFVAVRITNKSTTGFTVEVGSTFTGTIGYDVFV